MIKSPYLAVLRIDEQDLAFTQTLFARHDYQIYEIDSLADLSSRIEHGEKFDAVVIPLRLHGGNSGVSACLQIKADPILAQLPIVGLFTSKDRAVLRSFYGAGADVVLVAPFDPELCFLQIGALARQRRSIDEYLSHSHSELDLKASPCQALNGTREGVILLNTELSLTYLNHAAVLILGLGPTPSKSDYEKVAQQCQPLIKMHQLQSMERQTASGGFPSAESLTSNPGQEISLSRINGQIFSAAVKILMLQNERKQTQGWAIFFYDTLELTRLSYVLLQAQRVQALALLTSASSLRLLQQQLGKIPVAPGAALEELALREPEKAEINIVLTALLELADLTLSPSVIVKVSTAEECPVKVRQSDLFKLLGFMLMHAVEIASFDGEVQISTSLDRLTSKKQGVNKSRQVATIVISGEAKRESALQSQDDLQRLLQGDLSRASKPDVNPSGQQAPLKLGYGLEAAQDIADRYGCMIEFQQLGNARLKMRVRLPVS